MREAVRSGRRANFFITENKFIDYYAAKVGGSGVAVYSILQRCANSETKETWISAGKMADVLAMDKSTVYRYLKQLEDLRLIKSMRTREKTIYVVLPVPAPRPEVGSTPLFDSVDFKTSDLKNVDQESTWPVVASEGISHSDETDSHQHNASVASTPRTISSARTGRRFSENRNKEEQDFLNKTQEQDFLENSFENDNLEIQQSSRRIVTILGLSDTFIGAARAAVELKLRTTKLSMDGVVQAIVTEANHAERRGIPHIKFLEESLARTSAEKILDDINLPATNNLISIVAAAVKAEAKDIGISVAQSASLVTNAAIEDRRRGVTIDRFYFENVKWRSHARISKAEQRKLDNLEVNARVKQRLREKLGTS